MKVLIVLATLVACATAFWADCGSLSTVRHVNVTECTQAPCEFHPGGDYDVEINFIAASRIVMLNFKMFLVDGIQEYLLYDQSAQGNISPGEVYDLSFTLPVTDYFAGKSVELIYQVWDYDSMEEPEICVGADAFIHRPTPPPNVF